MDYTDLAERLFKDRNKTFKKNFIRYLSSLYSPLIDGYILPDDTVRTTCTGVELYSIDLKKISRNYSEVNDVLILHCLLDVTELHNNDPKKGKVRCRSYNIPSEIVQKGTERVFLSQKEKTNLIKTIKIDTGPDKTNPKNDPVPRYVEKILQRMKVDDQGFGEIEIEVNRFCQMYRAVGRFKQEKFDVVRGSKDHRLYSGYVYAPKEFRQLLRLDGQTPLVEGDVSCCHFHFLLKMMTDDNERKMMKKDLLSADPYMAMCSNPIGVSRDELKDNSHIFKYGNRIVNGYGMTDWEWSHAIEFKDQLFYRHISKRYPIFSESMSKEYIRCKAHRSKFACEVMKTEAKIMVDEVGQRCMAEELIYLPVHDGFMTIPSQYDRVCQIVTECFQHETGSVPLIRRK